MSKFCTNCGSPMDDGAKFCGSCGAMSKPDQAQQPAGQPPVAPPPPPAPPYQAPAQNPAPYTPAPQPVQAAQPPVMPRPPQAPPIPNQPAPNQPAPKKSKKGLIIGIIIAAVAVIAAVVVLLFVFVFNKDDSGSSKDTGSSTAPTDTVNQAASEKTEKETAAPVEDDPFYGEDNIDLVVWTPDQAVDLTTELCEEFIAQYPDKVISITVRPQGESDSATQQLNDRDASADVFGFSSDQLNRLVDAQALEPVYNPENVIARNSASSVEAAMVDGEMYAFPETGDNGYYLVYDKSVVSDEDAKSLEGILAACRKAGKKFVMDAGNGYYSCMFAFTGGLKIEGLDDDGTQIFNYYDEDEVVDSLEAFAKLFHEYSDVFMSSETAKITTGFASNPRTVAAGIDGSWDSAASMKALGSDYGAVKLPTINIKGEDKQIISMHGFKMIGVNSTTYYPNAAQLLADYLTDEGAQIKRAEELGWGPSNISAGADPSVSGDETIAALLEQSEYAVPMTAVAATFWSPMGTLGNSLWRESDISRATIKKNFEKTIDNILDL